MLPLTNLTNTLSKSYLLTAGLVKTVDSSTKLIKRSNCQLIQIERNDWDAKIRRKAASHLLKNNKLNEIATDLKKRILDFQNQTINRTLASEEVEMLHQFIVEVDLLREMHFRVAKTYTPFISEMYEVPVVRMGQMAA